MSEITPPSQGVFRALATGFDRIAARPWLILPPLLLDGALWLGPRLQLPRLFASLAGALVLPADAAPELVEQVSAAREMLVSFGSEFNLFSAASTFPVGVPSLMAATMPGRSPLGVAGVLELSQPAAIAAAWAGLTLIGLTLAAVYHAVVARAAAPNGAPAPFGQLWLRLIGMTVVAYLGIGVIGFVSLMAASLVNLITPFLGTGVAFLGFTLLFWLGVYLMFTPHGLVRYRLGLVRAMRESVGIVRVSFFPVIGFLAVVVLVSWLSGLVWQLPPADSWYSGLAVVGHAFVSATLLAASYVFYVGRRQALQSAAGNPLERRETRGA